ncbi:PREDICTED: very long-chain specific acyl-CoA dehydrogenase, mitochondrial-like [Amphimedon queenslandica]|uniref:Very long-chain specific acyl-CoA dehydrogenase, mitochondrial n=1 Tax=Amphimedon queenslandica TaxID=400682 RepID=A0A1X7VL62_AMPQE|nr:PREDICTED: very long-chain specific acyl-CoA dehydrogenase, mitochondrial-like [Amphimedon queenslandica]|eukprot:XP_003383685.1 PREDICTED: very long-chain specific acyl-CoA dehydrogenase, mitochondrial-like [Amphimedon queenslandica]
MASLLLRSAATLIRPCLQRSNTPVSSVLLSRLYSDKKPPETDSFVMNTFLGRMNTTEVFPYPDVMSTEERENIAMFVDPVNKFFEEVNDAARNDKEETVPPEIMAQLKDMGAFGLQVPTNLKGLGLTNTQYARLTEIIGGYDLGVGIMLGAHQSIGFKGILLFGNEQQKEKYLPMVASGEKIAAYCLTEPTSGSDANSIRSRAVKSDDGKHYVLNGGKIWISNGGIADIFTVFAQTPVLNPATGETKDKVSAFIVERSFPGVTSGPPEKKMGIKASNTAEVHFDNVHVPVENLLGGEGEGFKVAMNILNNGRFGMASALSGTMRKLISRAVDQVSNRVQFGNKLEVYGVVREKLARMTLAHFVTESMAYLLSGNMDSGSVEFQLEAAISKIYGSEAAWMVADECIQLHGGMGFMTECGLERVMRDLRIFRIFEGSNDILRLFISLTGLQFAGKHLRAVQSSIKSGDVNTLFSEGFKRTKRVMGMSTVDSINDQVHHKLATSANQMAQCVGEFGGACDHLLMKYRKNIIHEQFLLQRLANASIDLYGMAAVLSRTSKSLSDGSPSANHELLLATTFCQQANSRIKTNLASLSARFDIELDSSMADIAKATTENGGVVSVHPLRI